jgi:hypothetical protein
MAEHLNARERHRGAKAMVAPTHKFSVGLQVSFDNGSASGLYRVTRQLPNGGQGLQYRIRSDRDGQERVVLESALQRHKTLFNSGGSV